MCVWCQSKKLSSVFTLTPKDPIRPRDLWAMWTMNTRNNREQIQKLMWAVADDKYRWPSYRADIAAATFRCLWKCHLESPQDEDEVNERLFTSVLPILCRMSDDRFHTTDLHDWFLERPIIKEEEVAELRGTTSFEEYVNHSFLARANENIQDDAAVLNVWREWKPRIISLSPRLVVSIKNVHEEYMLWLQKHADAVDKIAWEAFEQLVAEIFASRGFDIDLTGRIRNRSSDILAVRTDEFGVETKYLIECKRYDSAQRVGLDVVNGVIGSARRADVDHAFLVTSSFFTKDVSDRRSTFEQLRLHLRDGDDVREWLGDYKPRGDWGLWLASGWDECIQTGRSDAENHET